MISSKNVKKYGFLLFVFWSFSLQAQNWQDLKFNHLTVDDGLSSNRVYGVLQDKRGLLWITTNNDLNRYDGYEFKKYYFNAQDDFSISGNEVFSIYEDSKDNLWLGTLGAGICRYYKNKDKFFRYPELRKNTVFKILEDDNHNLWVVVGNFLGKLNQKIGKFENIIANYKLPLNNLEKICKGNRPHEFWLRSSIEGLFLLNTQTLTIKNFSQQENEENSLTSNNIFAMFVDKQGLIWLGYTPKGVYCFKPDNQIVTHYQPKQNLPNTLPDYPITSFLEVDNTMWIGTQNSGLCIFNPQLQTFNTYLNISTNPFALEDGLYQDKQGRIYVSTYIHLSLYI